MKSELPIQSYMLGTFLHSIMSWSVLYVRDLLALYYVLVGALAPPSNFTVILIVGFMIDGIWLPINRLHPVSSDGLHLAPTCT